MQEDGSEPIMQDEVWLPTDKSKRFQFYELSWIHAFTVNCVIDSAPEKASKRLENAWLMQISSKLLGGSKSCEKQVGDIGV